MPSVRQRTTRLSDSAREDPSPVPSKRAKLSHSEEPQKAAKALLGGGRITAQNHDRSWNKRRSQFDESRAVVTNGVSNGDVDMSSSAQPAVVEISSESEEEDSEDEDADEEDDPKQPVPLVNGITQTKKTAKPQEEPAAGGITKGHPDTRDNDEDGEDADDDDEGAPTFGELMAQHDPISVEDDEQTALVPAPNQSLAAPNALTLTSVLTQALRTNDRQLLESCLQLNDLESVRKTIERLPSPLVATLLKKLSERLHRRPGRAGNLLIWVQWSLVAHGGYLATQPDVIRKLQELTRVIKERAAALQPLMGLKGRLDMLAAQVELRKSAQAEQQASRRSGEEDAVIYVEGEESSSSDEEDDDDEMLGQSLAKRITGRDYADVGEAESSGDEAMLVNGVASSDDEDEEEEDEDITRLIDDEAEDSDEDDAEEDDLSEEDLDDDEIEEGSDDEEDDRPATRRSTALRSAGFTRR